MHEYIFILFLGYKLLVTALLLRMGEGDKDGAYINEKGESKTEKTKRKIKNGRTQRKTTITQRLKECGADFFLS
jgi:hypothetical protein